MFQWRPIRGVVIGALCALVLTCPVQAADAPLGGFIPFVGIGLTAEFETFDSDPTGAFFIADPAYSWGSPPLGPGSAAYFDLAVLDTGAATHILTQTAASSTGFSIQNEGLRGTNFQTIFGASGAISLRINDPLGVYAAGLGDRVSAGAALTMNTSPTSEFRGQTSFSMLEAPTDWELPNIIGLPMAAQHAIAIRNSDPQIFQLQGRTVRTPDIELFDLGTGNEEGITRRTNLRIRPSAGFIQGPLYVQNLDIFTGDFHDNPLSPSVVENGAIFVEIDATNGTDSLQDTEFLFDTGADLSVISEVTAARLGIDVEFEQPDFFLEVEGGGGVTSGVPGYYLDELSIDTVGGSFVMQNVPVAVLDLPNPNDPANVVDGILGMHVFTGRDIVIDANPAASPSGGLPPRLYIGDPVAASHSWATNAASGSWATASNWSAPGSPDIMWDATVANVSGSNQTAVVSANSTVYRMTVSGTPTASMTLQINAGATLTTYGETLIETGGRIELAGGKLDAQFVNVDGGVLAGEGEVFVGTGPLFGQIRNLSGRIEPGDPIGQLTIDGDLSQQAGGTLAIDLSGITPITQYDRLAVDRFAFLSGTLEVDLASFTPTVGAMFTILTAGEGVVGEFDQLLLPGGFDWDVDYAANQVVLTVLGISAGLDGDFNFDGTVNMADYVWWRKKGGSEGDYLLWRTNFGRTTGTGGNAIPGVPEPVSAAPFLMSAVALALSRRRAYSARSVLSVDEL
jgi:predicted aspartyl protease